MCVNGKPGKVSRNELATDDVRDLLGFLTDDNFQDNAEVISQFLRPGNPQSGKERFVELRCGSCHHGASLTRRAGNGHVSVASNGRLDIANVIAALWNHSPQIWRIAGRLQKQSGVSAQTLADLMAYWYSERFEHCNDNVATGKSLFETKTCSACHEVGSDDFVIPADKDELLAQMWSHVPDMVRDCADNDITWPHMLPGELSAIANYLINADDRMSHK